MIKDTQHFSRIYFQKENKNLFVSNNLQKDHVSKIKKKKLK